jgi:hypothetical protein
MLRPTLIKGSSYAPFVGRDWRSLNRLLAEASDVLRMACPRRRDYQSEEGYLSDLENWCRMLESLEELRQNAEATYECIRIQYKTTNASVTDPHA